MNCVGGDRQESVRPWRATRQNEVRRRTKGKIAPPCRKARGTARRGNGARPRRGRSTRKRLGSACQPGQMDPHPRPKRKIAPSCRKARVSAARFRGVGAARVAFVVGRGAVCLRGGFWAWVVLPDWATTPTVSWWRRSAGACPRRGTPRGSPLLWGNRRWPAGWVLGVGGSARLGDDPYAVLVAPPGRGVSAA